MFFSHLGWRWYKVDLTGIRYHLRAEKGFSTPNGIPDKKRKDDKKQTKNMSENLIMSQN